MLPGALLIIPVILMYTALELLRLSRQSLRQRGAITEPDSRRQVRICRRGRAPSRSGMTERDAHKPVICCNDSGRVFMPSAA
ncbi:hypothetical protein LNP74_24025 [Klebsiella pneumoniae subsp. pneumoniae]|nr:hypothetical protein [Klebsiella pneumoniae subsp. pneumoniae]